MLLETKSLLAKLMATENLQIEQRKVETAMFNTKTRVLTVPILANDVPAYTYDLFMGHEVGHALYTPYEGWVDSLVKKKLNKSILNVVEDSRIERKVKHKYPGIRSSFFKAYSDLHSKDFFATKGKDLDSMNFIDRINLHQKVGAGLNIKFKQKELELLKEVESTESFEDVVEVSKRIQEYIEQSVKEQFAKQEPGKQKVKVKITKNKGEGEEPEIPEGIDSDADTEFEIEFEEESRDTSGSSIEKPEDESVDEDNGQSGSGDSTEGEQAAEPEGTPSEAGSSKTKFEEQLEEAIEKATKEALKSFTDEAYKEKEKSLFDKGKGRYTYANIPKMDISKAIYDHKPLYRRYSEERNVTAGEEFIRIRNESNKVVSYLVKEFEMRKNADQSKRATVSKTGDLNMNKLFAYKLTEDIFKKVTVVPGGKSHGLVMFLDWSGSMANHIENTIKQLINLVLFCKKVNIPYEVYAFCDCYEPYVRGRSDPKLGDLILGDFQLFNFLSSRMSAKEFTYACSALIGMAKTRMPHWLRMGSTPLNETVLSAMEIVPAFQKKYRLQIVNTVFLTDGDGNNQRTYYSEDPKKYSASMTIPTGKGDFVILRDPVTKNEVRAQMDGFNYNIGFTNAMVQLLKLRTKSNIVGFYVIAGREFNNVAEKWFKDDNLDVIKENFKKERYAVLQNSGFDEYYFLRSNDLDTDDSAFDVDEGVSQRGLVTAFTKYAGNKVANRVVLNRFIGMIA